MSSCIAVLYMTLLTLGAAPRCPALALVQAGVEPQSALAEADRLYAGRADLAQARKAADLWSRAVESDPKDFTSAWKLARAGYWLGKHVPGPEVPSAFERGMSAARRAIALAPGRPEGHFWLAADMAGLAETQGLVAGLRYRGAIRDELERVLAIDPAYLQGSADRALGRWYFKVPRLFGGSKRKSEAHLRKALAYNPQSTVTWAFLADTLFAMDRDEEARAALRHVIDAPLDPEWTPEDLEFKAEARARLDGKKP